QIRPPLPTDPDRRPFRSGGAVSFSSPPCPPPSDDVWRPYPRVQGQDLRPGVHRTLDAILDGIGDARPSLARPGGSPLNPKFFRNGIVMLVLVVGTAALLFTWIQTTTPSNPIGYSQFLNDVGAGKVKEVSQQGDTLTVTVNTQAAPYTVTVPSILTQVYPDMLVAAKAGGQTLEPSIFKAEPAPDT